MPDRRPATKSSDHEEAADGYFAPLAPAKYLRLTTFKPDGLPVTTSVHGMAVGDRAYFRARDQSDTAEHLRHTDEVQVTACTALGMEFGPPLDAVARRLPGDTADRIAAELARKYPFRQRFVIPLVHRMRRWQMAYYELVTYEVAAQRWLSRGEQVVEGSDGHNVLGYGGQARVHCYQGVGLQPGDREVLGVSERVPVVLAGDPPGDAARYPVTEQPYLYLGHPLVGDQGFRFGALPGPDVVQQKLQRLRADRVGRDQLMSRGDVGPGIHQVKQGRCVDHVTSHRPSVAGGRALPWAARSSRMPACVRSAFSPRPMDTPASPS